MSLTARAIQKNRVTFVALLVVAAAGLFSYFNSPQAEDPGFIIRTATVVTYFPGASPERVELLVSDKLEKAIQEMPELDDVRSESKTGASIIHVDIKERYTHMRPIWDSLRRKVNRTVDELPEDVIGPIVNDEFGDVFGIVLTITGEGFNYAELKDVADEVRDELLLMSEVAKVDIYGAQEERVFVEYNNARLAELGLSPFQLQQILESRNIIIPGGDVRVEDERIALEPSGNFESIDDLRRSVIILPGQKDLLFLDDVAHVHRGYVDPPRTRMHSTGVPCLGLAVSMREGGNIAVLAEQVMALYHRLPELYPIGIEFDVVAYQPSYVEKKVTEFTGNLLQAVAIVLLVMLLTLGLRTGLVVATLIPMAMLMSLMVMYFLNIWIDQMSLASLIIALGLLVDNAIVMSESILVQMQTGRKAFDAAVDSARELQVPLLTSSLTTAAAFLPIFLAESSTGEYTAPLFKVVTITLLCSWVLALTMTPLLCVTFLRVNKKAQTAGYGKRFYRFYRGLLLVLLRHPLVTLSLILGVFVAAIYGFRYVPVIFFPPSDRAVLTMELELPNGTSIERTEEVVSRVEACMAQRLAAGGEGTEGILNWAAFIGEGGPRYVLSYGPEMSTPEYAYLIVNTTSRGAADDVAGWVRENCLEDFPGLEATLRPLELGPPVGKPIGVRVSGRDPDVLFDLVDDVKEKIRSIPGTTGITDDWGSRSKKLFVKIDQPRARRAGVTNQDIAISLQTVLSGFETTQYREADEVIPVVLRSVAADRQDIGKLETLNVYAQLTGESVPLKQVADVEVQWQPARIKRQNRLRTVTVEADLFPGVTATEVNRVLLPWLEDQRKGWGLGYRYELGGEAETSGEANASIAAKLPIAGFIILLLMVGQFNSLRRTFIVLATIPLGLIGVVGGLVAARSYFGFMTLLGIISLAGIVINNAIVLLDRIRIEIEENGLEPPNAVVEAAQRRFRPILLTTATTVGGILPLWFGGGPMWEPMAISIIFGLLFATVLTLGFVPVLYSVLFRVSYKGFRYEAETSAP